ncbi:MAG TPA: lysine exporter LysO family protein [Peptococcaceae bacterium]|nr:lysine exporter LysO family protein [Peptococcaceae bacterium]
MFLGVVLAWKKLLPAKILTNSGKIMTLSLVFLLCTMGLKIGLDKATLRNFGEYGLQALLFAVATIVLSLAMVSLLEKVFVPEFKLSFGEEALNIPKEEQPHPYRLTAIVLAAFFLGIIIGLIPLPAGVTGVLPSLTNWALCLTVFAVGLELGQNKDIWKQILSVGHFVFLAPLGVAVGSILAGMLMGKILGWTWGEGGAVGAGFGWYSLSGVLISELHSVGLGTIAFLSNILREILAIIIVPFLADRLGKLTLLAPGGATTMDTTLPVIAAVGPPGIAILAFINGFVLSTFVPILVPFLLSI